MGPLNETRLYRPSDSRLPTRTDRRVDQSVQVEKLRKDNGKRLNNVSIKE